MIGMLCEKEEEEEEERGKIVIAGRIPFLPILGYKQVCP